MSFFTLNPRKQYPRSDSGGIVYDICNKICLIELWLDQLMGTQRIISGSADLLIFLYRINSACVFGNARM